MPAQITFKPDALTTHLDGLDYDEVERLLAATADLVNAAEQLLGAVPDYANPVVIHRQHLAELQAARDAFLEVAEPSIEVREVPGTEPQMTDKAALSTDSAPAEEPPRRPAGGALERAGYEDGDLVDAFRQNPGGQA